MRKKIIMLSILLSAMWIPSPSFANGDVNPGHRNTTLSGFVRDATDGEMLIGATIYIESLFGGTVTNTYGFYSLGLDKGKYNITYSYVGYETVRMPLTIQVDTVINIALNRVETTLNEVIVNGEVAAERLAKAQMSVNKLDIKNIRQIPALMGEVDLIKALQLLPGVQATAEGGSGFSVRGGSPDQNLILLDEALVYNPSHLMGFFSVFNNDAIKGVELYKGDIPAAYGGRLSSVVDVRMDDGNSKQFAGQGGIGTISSRLMVEGPLQKDRSSFMLAGRRTYADVFLALSSNEKLKGNSLYFYDFNGKANYIIDDKNRVFLSGYFGKDVFGNDNFGIGWGNQTFTGRWNHLFNSRLFSNFSLIYSRFNYNLGVPSGQPNAFNWVAVMKDVSAKSDFTWFSDANNSIRFGVSATWHKFHPGKASGLGEETIFNTIEMPQNRSLETGIYISNDQKIGSRFVLKYGLRFSMLNNVGKGTSFHFDENFNKVDSTIYSKGKFFNTYTGFEPRLSVSYNLSETNSVKAAYTRNVQYVHLAQNSTAGTPLDIWFSSSPNVKPQIGDQFSLGYFHNLPKQSIETSIEGFYKLNHNAIDFKDHAELLLNEYIEGELRFGEAWSYGIEVLLKRSQGRVNGWVSYTWSRTFRKIPEINSGKKYPATYDRPHDISIVLNYALSKRWSLGANWVYATGSAVTFPTGRFKIGNTIVPVYSERNSYRLPDYHRLDVSVTLNGKDKPGRRWKGEWNFSAYNVYNKKNPWVINFVSDENDTDITHAEMTYLFGIVPSITYNFKF